MKFGVLLFFSSFFEIVSYIVERVYWSSRFKRQDHRSSLTSKEARKAHKELLQRDNQMYEESEGFLYTPGIVDA